MAVDKQLLEQLILENADGDAEMADFLRKRYAANDALATKFVGGFMRQSDYTKKLQALSDERKQFGDQTAQLDQVRKALEAAETEKVGIMRELAGHRISVAKARELMKLLQEKYTLTDEDLPGMSDLIETRKSGVPTDNTPDIETRLTAFGDDLMRRMEDKFVKSLMPELGAMANLPLVWGEIGREHEELTGKRLSFTEQQEILKGARDENKPLRQVWEEKFSIAGDDGLRMKKRDERLHTQWQSDREKEEAEKRSKQALEVVTPQTAELGNGPGISAAFKTRFRTYETDPNKPATPASDGVPTLKVEPGQHVRQSGDRGPSAAQRAAAKYIEGQQRKSA